MLNNLVPTSPHNDDDGTFLYDSTTSADQLHASRLSIVKPWFAFQKLYRPLCHTLQQVKRYPCIVLNKAVLLVVVGGVN